MQQYAGMGDKATGRETFKLLGRSICGKAMCTLVGFTNPSFVKAKAKREEEIHRDEHHGNTVSTVSAIRL